MKALAFEQVVPKGDLAYRMVKNYARLEGKEYRPEQIFDIDKNGWPGDWEGRTILALALLARSTGRTPAYLDAILEKLESEFNERGYLKDILPAGMANEQQLSGHNWLLRGWSCTSGAGTQKSGDGHRLLSKTCTCRSRVYMPLTRWTRTAAPSTARPPALLRGNLSTAGTFPRISAAHTCAWMR